MGICGIFFGIFHRIDFEIIVFERRRQCFFRPCPAGSATFELTFDSRFCHFIEVHEAEVLENSTTRLILEICGIYGFNYLITSICI
jgi:hypothetical protein